MGKESLGTFHRQYFEEHVEQDRFLWQTRNLYVSRCEQELLDILWQHDADRLVLEVGSGEGANLMRLQEHFRRVLGLDLSFPRLSFCQKTTKHVTLLCADAARLPFVGGAFDIVLCRDLLHHVPVMEPVVAEMWRVCRQGGHVILIEANGRNPIIKIQGMLIKVEANVRSASSARFARLLAGVGCERPAISMQEPMPIFRFILHYRFGLPVLARYRWIRMLLDWLHRIAGVVIPREYWAYVVAEAKKESQHG